MQKLSRGNLVLSRVMDGDKLLGFLIVDHTGESRMLALAQIEHAGLNVRYKNAQYDPQYKTLVGTHGVSLTNSPSITKNYVTTSKDGITVLCTICEEQTGKPIGVVAFNALGQRFNLSYNKLSELAGTYTCCNFMFKTDAQYGMIAVQKDGTEFEYMPMTVPKVEKKPKTHCVDMANPRAIPVIGVYNIDLMRNNEFSQPCQDKLVRTMMNMQKLTPYYYTVFAAISRQPAPIGTMGVTEDVLYYDMKFVASLSVAELTFVLIHEIMHLAMQHGVRFGRRKNHDLWNIATDLYINSIICKDFGVKFGGGVVNIGTSMKPIEIKTPDFGVFIETIGEEIDLSRDTPESIYEQLLKENPQLTGSKKKHGKGDKSGKKVFVDPVELIQQGLQELQEGMQDSTMDNQTEQDLQSAMQDVQDGTNEAIQNALDKKNGINNDSAQQDSDAGEGTQAGETGSESQSGNEPQDANGAQGSQGDDGQQGSESGDGQQSGDSGNGQQNGDGQQGSESGDGQQGGDSGNGQQGGSGQQDGMGQMMQQGNPTGDGQQGDGSQSGSAQSGSQSGEGDSSASSDGSSNSQSAGSNTAQSGMPSGSSGQAGSQGSTDGQGSQSGQSGMQNGQSGMQGSQSGMQSGQSGNQSGMQGGQSGMQNGQSGNQSGNGQPSFGMDKVSDALEQIYDSIDKASGQGVDQMQSGAELIRKALEAIENGEAESGGGFGEGDLDKDTTQDKPDTVEGDMNDDGESGDYTPLKEVNVTYNGKKLKGTIMKDVMSNKDPKSKDDLRTNIEASRRALQKIDTKIKLEEKELGQELSKNAGAGGALTQRYIEVGLSAGVDWKVLFRNICKDRPKKTFTLANPNQDYMSLGMTIADRRPIGKPTHLSRIKFCVDVSGSVSQKELQVVLSEINNIYTQFDLDGELIYWSTMIGDAGMFSNLRDMLKIQPNSDGGTDVRCVFEYLAGKIKVHGKTEPDKVKDIKAVFILTDGCFSNNYEDFARMFGKRVIWLITGVKGNTITFNPPFGRVIGLEID